MLFLDVEKDGVLGWQDWQTFNFGNSNWDYTGTHDWLPDYHGDGLFLKIHRPPQALPDPRLNWENPFAFFDIDGDGLTEMGMRWLDPLRPVVKGLAPLSGVLNEAFLTLRPRQRLGQGQRDRLRHVAARVRRPRRAVPVDGRRSTRRCAATRSSTPASSGATGGRSTS